MAAEASRAPMVRGWKTVAARVAAFWREIEPGISISESSVERWDGCGEGPGTCVDFEGFGLSLTLFVARVPKAVR